MLMGLNVENIMLLSSHFCFCSASLFSSFFLCLSPSLSPCQSADLWLCLSEGHTSLPMLLFVSTPLHFSTLPSLKATSNQQKLTLGCYAHSSVCFVALPRLYLLGGNLTGLHSYSTVVLTKCLAGLALCCCC